MGSWVTFESLLGHFGVGLPESLSSHFNSFCVSAELGARPLHKCKQIYRKREKDHNTPIIVCREFTKSGPKKPWQPQTWQDLTRFSPLDFSLLSPDFRGSSYYIAHKCWRKRKKSSGEPPVEDGAPKLQISVPCRGRTCPDQSRPPLPRTPEGFYIGALGCPKLSYVRNVAHLEK